MILLESGPARTDKTYWFVVSVALLAFAGWFVRDGLYGYKNKNRVAAEHELQRWAEPPFNLGETPTEEDFERLKQLTKAGSVRRSELEEILKCEPLKLKTGAVAGGTDTERFASVYGMASVPIGSGGHVTGSKLEWTAWGKTQDEIEGQFYWALIPVLLALYTLFRAFRAATLRAVIDDEGMTYGGKRLAFADIKSMRDYDTRGWFDVYYGTGDAERKLRVDNQKIAQFDEIAELLSQKTGMPNPILAEEEETEEADEQGGGTNKSADAEAAASADRVDSGDNP